MDAKARTKRPANTAFKQQRLKAWQPILTPKTVLPAFFAIGAVFIPLGVGLYLASDKVVQVGFDYTSCNSGSQWNYQYPVVQASYDPTTKICTIYFNIDNDMNGPVFMYYRLSNFYQNHRRYVKSFDSNQLANKLGTGSPGSNCNPISNPSSQVAGTYNWTTTIDSSAQIYPCGLIANSFFTDDISDLYEVANPNITIHFEENGIAWPSDSAKYLKSDLANHPNLSTLVYPPPQWVKGFPGKDYSKGYNAANFPDISQMQRLQVWMRPAGLPNFRKLWGRRDGSVPAAEYMIKITQNFDVSTYGGTKSIVISTVSVLGGKNPFLGSAYIAVGVICWVLGLMFLLRHMIKPRKLGDYTYLSWNQPQRGSGTAGGEGTQR
ncbi:hypothetical protein HDU76_002111 [Blyttiomyces sp. JEL0837]|nr:hypothetical protein HDU76_002111 [Blyttiomyces sp. JEL0837]